MSSRSGWHVCGEARTDREAVGLALKLKPDIVITDLHLPELNGIEATRRIIQARRSTEVLFYTMHDEEHVIIESLRAGARGHVLKSDSEGTLIEAITSLAKHVPYFSTKATETLLDQLLKSGGGLDESRVLTRRERQIIKLLADGKSNKVIAPHLQISVKTVEAHRSAIMRKLGFTSITDLVRYAIRNRLVKP